MEKSFESRQLWFCCRQRAGPLVKECRALRPRLSSDDSPQDRRDKNEIIRSPHSAVCRSQADRLELRLALFGYEGNHYTLTYDDEHLPKNFAGVRNTLRAFFLRAKRWRNGRPFDYIYCIEGKHGDHRFHIHSVFRDHQLPPAVMQYLWKYGEVDDEPVLRGKHDSYRRLAKYFNKEATDGIVIPIGARPWVCSRSLSAQLPAPERWQDSSGVIHIPDDVYSSGRASTQNEFGSYYYGWYIEPKNSTLYLNQ